MNPIFYFDELDKVSDSERGKEIIGILTHLTDTSQNSQFHDKYFSEIDFDVSKCLFVFSYNNESMVNPILKDRMYKIKVNGYTAKEKIVIGQQFLIPKIMREINFRENDIIIPDKVIHYIVENYTKNQYDSSPEEGVRNLKRCLETIYAKLNLFRLVKSGTKSFITEQIKLKVEFPYTVSASDVDVFIKQNKSEISCQHMYI
jgi:ATP-dependent Lon protease